MPFSQHRMALAPLFVAVIAVLVISGSSVYAGTRPAHVHAAAPTYVAIPDTLPEPVGPVEPNNTLMGPVQPDSTPIAAASVPEAQVQAIPPSASDVPPAVAAASLGAPTVLGPQLSIATVALSHVGTYGGECWVFMQHVVREATGRTIGTDYIKGFLNAGAYEVAPADAGPGDIIQILDNRYTTWDADYAGLHTSIVIDNHHDGSFTVVEANAEWDGMVTVNTKYRPEDTLKQMPWLAIHVFHVPQTP
jgi:hypothetical protein